MLLGYSRKINRIMSQILKSFLIYENKTRISFAYDSGYIITKIYIQIKQSVWRKFKNFLLRPLGIVNDYIYLDSDIVVKYPRYSYSSFNEKAEAQALVDRSDAETYLSKFPENNPELGSKILKSLEEYKNGKR